MLNADPRICPHCGNIDSDADPVVDRQVWIGGHGWVWILQCKDQARCWDRWDRQHGNLTYEDRLRADAAEEARYRASNS